MVIIIQVRNVVIRTGIRQLISQFFPDSICIQTHDKMHSDRLIAAFYDEKKVLIITDTEFMDWYKFKPDHFKLGVIDFPTSQFYLDINGDESAFVRSIELLFIGKPLEEEHLSRREKEIAILIAKGISNKEIAENLFISEHTVRTHRKSIYKKTKCKSAIELSKWLSFNQT